MPWPTQGQSPWDDDLKGYIDSGDDSNAGDVAAEAALARNADNLASGTVADARLPSGIARDSEVTAAVAAEATTRAAADTALDTRLDTIEGDYQTASGLDAATATDIADPASATRAALSTAFISRATRPQHAPALGLFFPEAEGAVGNGSTDDTAAILATWVVLQAAGGGSLVLDASKTYRCDGRLAFAFGGTSGTPTQKPVRITCFGTGSASGQWVTNPLNGGGTLDLRYDGTDTLGQGKIDTRGCGRLEIDHINLISGGTDNFPLVHVTNTTVHIHDNLIKGNSANQQFACLQDGIILGGTDTVYGDGLNAPFQGYGSRIHDNQFDHIRVGVLGRKSCNSVTIDQNVFTTKCGNDGTVRLGGAIELQSPSVGYCVGNIITNNVIEVTGYKYGIAVEYAVNNVLGPNGIWDPPGSGYLAAYYIGPNARYNIVTDGFHDSAYPLTIDTQLLTTVITSAASRSTFWSQYSVFKGAAVTVRSNGFGFQVLANTGDRGYTRVIGGNTGTPSYPEYRLGTSAAVQVTDLVTTNGSNVVTSATAAWTAEQKYMPIAATGIPSNTLITRVISATSVELSANCTATATGITAQIGRGPSDSGGTGVDEAGWTRRHWVAKGTAPAAGIASAIGTAPNGATAAVSGTDTAFILTLHTASSVGAAGNLSNVTYNIAFTSSKAVPVLTPMNAAAAAAMVTNQLYVTVSNTVLTLTSGTGTLPTSTDLIFSVHTFQT